MFTECTEEKIKVYCPHCIIMPVSLCLSSHLPQIKWASLVVQMAKNLPAMQETRFYPWIGKIPWRRELLPTPVILAWRIPWIEESGGLQYMGLQRVIHD